MLSWQSIWDRWQFSPKVSPLSANWMQPTTNRLTVLLPPIWTSMVWLPPTLPLLFSRSTLISGSILMLLIFDLLSIHSLENTFGLCPMLSFFIGSVVPVPRKHFFPRFLGWGLPSDTLLPSSSPESSFSTSSFSWVSIWRRGRKQTKPAARACPSEEWKGSSIAFPPCTKRGRKIEIQLSLSPEPRLSKMR